MPTTYNRQHILLYKWIHYLSQVVTAAHQQPSVTLLPYGESNIVSLWQNKLQRAMLLDYNDFHITFKGDVGAFDQAVFPNYWDDLEYNGLFALQRSEVCEEVSRSSSILSALRGVVLHCVHAASVLKCNVFFDVFLSDISFRK